LPNFSRLGIRRCARRRDLLDAAANDASERADLVRDSGRRRNFRTLAAVAHALLRRRLFGWLQRPANGVDLGRREILADSAPGELAARDQSEIEFPGRNLAPSEWPASGEAALAADQHAIRPDDDWMQKADPSVEAFAYDGRIDRAHGGVVSGVSAIETDLRFSGREDFWIIVATRSEDETEIRAGKAAGGRRDQEGSLRAGGLEATSQMSKRPGERCPDYGPYHGRD
jgi:hypothetical protein